MAINFVAGGAAISVFCRQNGIALKVIDAGVDYDFPIDSPIVPSKIARGSRNMRKEPAMTTGECEKALAAGRAFVRAEAEAGCNTIGFGEMGIGNTSPRSEERRVGKECRSRWSTYYKKKRERDICHWN